MTISEKAALRRLCKEGYTFEQIRKRVHCADVTIRRYMSIFSPTTKSLTVDKEK